MIRILIWIIFLIGGGALSIWLDLRWFHQIFSNIFFHIITFFAGVSILHFIMNASRNTGKLLARFGREGDIPRLETNKLVTTGIYSCMRHPMHFGLLFFPLAIALMLGSPTFILIVYPVEVIIMFLLIKFAEEPQAIHKFGDEYKEYMKRVPFFSLKAECLKQLFSKNPNLS